jgi:hypothetical protein
MRNPHLTARFSHCNTTRRVHVTWLAERPVECACYNRKVMQEKLEWMERLRARPHGKTP